MVKLLRFDDIPVCCRECVYLSSDWSEYTNITGWFCEKNVFFPVKSETCKKQKVKKECQND